MSINKSMSEHLKKHRDKIAQMKLDGTYVHPVTKNPLEKAQEDPKSLRKAVTAMCYDCMGRDADPDFRGRIRECACHDCPLYPLRPYQKKKDDTNER